MRTIAHTTQRLGRSGSRDTRRSVTVASSPTMVATNVMLAT